MAKLRLVFLRPFKNKDKAYLIGALGGAFDIVESVGFDDATLAESIQGMDVAIGSRLSPAVLAAADQLKLLQTPAAGLDGLDLPALAQRGIMVANSHSNAPLVAEYAIGMLLALFKRLSTNDRLLRSGIRPTGPDSYPKSLFGRTIGLLGLGHVGQAMLGLLAPWNVSILSAVRRPDQHATLCAHHQKLLLTTVENVLARSDAVVLSLPLTQHTRGLLDRNKLTLLRSDAVLVNVGRAEVIDRPALLQALAAGQLAGLGLDVWWSDRQEQDASEFTRFDRVIVSPHRAGADAENSPHLPGVVTNLLAYARNGKPLDIVDCAQGY